MNIDILKECEGAGRIGISGHIHPDGDCVGSCLSLWMYLQKQLPDAQCKVFLEEPDKAFAEIKGFELIDSSFGEEEPFDVFFVLDSIPDRIGDAVKYLAKAGKVINIDHHVTNKGCGDVNCIHPEMGSCCEVLYDLYDKAAFDADIAKAVYIGIIHDTGVFQYSNTTPLTFEKAAHLIGFGFNFSKIIQETFYQRTYIQTQIMGRAMMESIRFMDNRCVVSMVDLKTMEFYGACENDLDGIVNHLRNIEGISCAVFMHQTDVCEYKVSLRTNENVDASAVCAFFGGGGHARAAGCTMYGTFHDCINNLSAQIEKQLEQA